VSLEEEWGGGMWPSSDTAYVLTVVTSDGGKKGGTLSEEKKGERGRPHEDFFNCWRRKRKGRMEISGMIQKRGEVHSLSILFRRKEKKVYPPVLEKKRKRGGKKKAGNVTFSFGCRDGKEKREWHGNLLKKSDPR